MRCPSCQFICSDLRDLCPRCTIDLRPHKREIGLPVTWPERSYAELLKRANSPGLPVPEIVLAPAAIFEKLREVFARESPLPASPPEPATSTPFPPEPELTVPTLPDAGPAVIDLSVATDLSTVLDQLLAGNEELSFESTSTGDDLTEPPSLLTAADHNDEASEALARFLSLIAADSTAAPKCQPGEVEEQEENLTLEVEDLIAELAIPPGAAVAVPEPAITAPEMVAPVIPSRGGAGLDFEAIALFEECWYQLEGTGREQIVLHLDQFVDPRRQPEVELLFDLAAEAIEAPGRRLCNQITTSASTTLRSPELEAHLRAAERFTERARLGVFTPAGADERGAHPWSEPESSVEPAPLRRRASAFFIDLLILTLAALPGGLGLLFLSENGLPIDLSNFPALTAVDALTWATAAWISWLALTVLYPLFFWLFDRPTPGEQWNRLYLATCGGDHASARSCAVRALCLPASVVLGGWLPLMRGGLALQDYASGSFPREQPELLAPGEDSTA